MTIEQMHIDYINKALNVAKTKKEAAVMLGISEKTLYTKIYTYKLN